MRIAVWGLVVACLALPAGAQECFAGKPGKVSFDDGRVITIIQRHGDDLTYTEPYEGFQDIVRKTHLMLFLKTARAGARATEYRWTTRLPKLSQMVPGYHFDLKGTMKSGDGNALPYRRTGDVLGQEVIKVGDCPYEVVKIQTETFMDDQFMDVSTDYLSPDLMIVLRSEIVPNGAQQIIRNVVAIE